MIDFNSNRRVMVGMIQNHFTLFFSFRWANQFSCISDNNVNIIF